MGTQSEETDPAREKRGGSVCGWGVEAAASKKKGGRRLERCGSEQMALEETAKGLCKARIQKVPLLQFYGH